MFHSTLFEGAAREKKEKKQRGEETMLQTFAAAVGIFKVLPLKHSRLLMFDFVCRPSFLILESNVVHYKKVYESM